MKTLLKNPRLIIDRVHTYWQVRRLRKEVAQKAFLHNPEYEQYIQKQIRKSYKKNAGAVMRHLDINPRTRHLVALFGTYVKPSKGERILCIGCRNANELNYMEEVYKLRATGLDLFSNDARIVVGDMHKMPFQESEFDHLYSCHSLEHAYDIRIALREFVRVVKLGGSITIEVPVHFELNDTDFWDVSNCEKLGSMIADHTAAVLFQENGRNSGKSFKEVVRFIFAVKK